MLQVERILAQYGGVYLVKWKHVSILHLQWLEEANLSLHMKRIEDEAREASRVKLNVETIHEKIWMEWYRRMAKQARPMVLPSPLFHSMPTRQAREMIIHALSTKPASFPLLVLASSLHILEE